MLKEHPPAGLKHAALKTEKKNVFTDLAASRRRPRHHTHKSSTFLNKQPASDENPAAPSLCTVTRRIDLGKLSLHSLPFSRHPLGVTLRLKLKSDNRRVGGERCGAPPVTTSCLRGRETLTPTGASSPAPSDICFR